MTVGSSMESGRPADSHDEPGECFADIIEASRASILMSYQKALEAPDGPATGDACCRDQLLTLGSQIITDIIVGVRAGDLHHQDNRFTTSSGETTLKHALPPAQSLRAAEMFFEITTNSLAATSAVTRDSSLQRALVRYLDSVETHAEVHIQINGDEKLGPPAVIDEVYAPPWSAVRSTFPAHRAAAPRSGSACRCRDAARPRPRTPATAR